MSWIVGPLDLPVRAAQPFAWLTSLDSAEAESLMARAALTPADYADFAGRADAASRLARRRLVKGLIAGLADLHPDAVVIGRSTLGAPLVMSPDGWHVSLSARWPRLAVAVARQPVGVDLERVDQDPPPDDAFTPAERERIAGQPRLALALWTAKEAHAKRTGRARLYEARDIATRAEGGDLFARCRDHASRCLTIRDGDVVATLAVRQTDLD
ncbi:4'-phosphopantetheinyl transferase superfamily protein [uncultured Caulobacter sp.]|uniref:4'-phosphopantetheinyl transferase family protein n=1 Tax=uncultured Caulobacter sp. TaxID=158749 RepID=UPI002607D46B|nr:4'-phosphopantetheinyl transferase superfamily protein [uncultured Caulobacter sp.]